MRAKKNNGSLLLKLGVVLAVLAGAGFYLFSTLQGTARVKAAVIDTAVDAVTGSVMIHADGGFRDLKSESAGKVKTANLKPGSHFKKGDVLVELDTTDLDRAIAELDRKYDDDKALLKIRLANSPEKRLAEEKVETAKRMFALNTISADDLKAAQQNLANVETSLAVADFNERKGEVDYRVAKDGYALAKERMIVKAPFDGTIEGALTFEGALISAGEKVAIAISRKRVVAAKISEESFGRVQLGQTARLRLLTYGTKPYDAVVSELLPTADDAQRFTVYLKVGDDVDPEILKPNSTGEVTITVNQRPNAVMVPRRALFENNKVFVVEDGTVRKREVEVGYVALNKVEVRKGVATGELVILDPNEGYRDGQRVRTELVP